MARRQVLQLRSRRMSWEDAMEMYLRYRAAEGLRDATLKDYRQKIGHFFRTYPGSWPDSMEESLLEWLAAAIMVLDSGRIVQSGTHDELIADAGGLYRRLCELKLSSRTFGTGTENRTTASPDTARLLPRHTPRNR